MPRRHQILASNEIYHVFSRSVGHEEIFSSQKNLHRIYELLDFYRFKQTLRFSQFQQLSHERQKNYLDHARLQPQLVEIFAFAFMPNHYHILLKQLQDRGTTVFIGNIQNSFAKFYNLKNNRHGTLFQNLFKAKRVVTDEEFLHVSRYIHLNPVISYIISFDQLNTYPWTSFAAYMQDDPDSVISKNKILKLISTKGKYYQFLADQENYQKKLSEIKHLKLD